MTSHEDHRRKNMGKRNIPCQPGAYGTRLCQVGPLRGYVGALGASCVLHGGAHRAVPAWLFSSVIKVSMSTFFLPCLRQLIARTTEPSTLHKNQMNE